MRIVIVGGGTAGWMAASYLSKSFGDKVALTVIESPTIGTIGVGEATFSTVKLFFDHLGLTEDEWMPHCGATYKMAIRYENWTKDGSYFHHPFERLRSAAGYTGAEWWLKGDRKTPFDYACYLVPTLCDAKSSPRFLDGGCYDESVNRYFDHQAGIPNTNLSDHKVQYPYGYHFNAGELAQYLMRYATATGVRQVLDEVVDVDQDDIGITGLKTAKHGVVEGDVFIDCSGFRGLLINKTLKEPFISFSDVLLNDCAVAIQVPRDPTATGLAPYTVSHGLSAGWSWTIPLYNRDGTGYVYSSTFSSPEDAEKELRAFVGPRAEGRKANHVKMRVGRCRNSWVKNCVAIGLSSGFVEPLESTGIFFIQHAIEEFVRHFPRSRAVDPALVAGFNRSMNGCVDGVLEFLSLHYCVSTRDDTPYWRAVRDAHVPEKLAARLHLWKSRLPSDRTIFEQFHGFEAYSWSTMMLGLKSVPPSLPILDLIDNKPAQAMFANIEATAKRLIMTLPSHDEYLTAQRRRAGLQMAAE